MILYIIDISKGYHNFTVLEILEINKSHCAILHVFYQKLFKLLISFGSFTFHFDEDDELLDEGMGTSGLDFSDDQGNNIGSRDDQGGDTSAIMTRE